jgi:starch synthase
MRTQLGRNGVKIVFCSSEVFPFAKTGGLADVASALPLALAKKGCQVKVFMPFYKSVKPDKVYPDYGYSKTKKVEFYFIKNDEYFKRDHIYGTPKGDYPDNLERFSFYSKGVLELVKKLGFKPDIIHVNDWQASLVNIYLKTTYSKDEFFKKTKTLLTIHNMAYQGIFPKDKFPLLGLVGKYFSMDYLEYYDKVSLLKGGIVFSDLVNTVSPTYAKQIQTAEYGCGLEGVLSWQKSKLLGILNAIDYDIWDPKHDKFIYKTYSPKTLKDKAVNKQELQKELGLEENPDKLVLGMVSRLAEQKGIDILSEALDQILKQHQVVILGLGDQEYHDILEKKQKKFKNTLSLNLKFEEALAHKIYAGSDLFLLPSRFEPCGLSQMISYKYATIPLVHHTGGLVDTVKDVSQGGGGFVFKNHKPSDLIVAVDRAKKLFSDKNKWSQVLNRITQYNFSWSQAADNYIEVYKQLQKCQ